MKILMTGATGFIGKELGKRLCQKGHELHVLTRDVEKARREVPFPALFWEWDPEKAEVPQAALKGVESLIHLAGESIAAKRWSEEQKEKILSSRVVGTRKIAAALKKTASVKSAIFASAIGYYGHRSEEALTEESAAGRGFLADVCRQWEEAAKIDREDIRRVFVRIGIVLGSQGGMMQKVLPIFRSGVGGVLGNGRQWMSWIHLDDLVGIFVEAVENTKVVGVVNGVSPHPVTNAEFTRTLAKTLKRPAPFPAPSIALKIALGEMSELLLGSQKVFSAQMESVGFRFAYPTLTEALSAILVTEPKEDEFIIEQWIPEKVENVFSFFGKAHNLQTITPPWLDFEILGMSTPQIEKDTTLDYRLKIHEIPVSWQTLITVWEPGKRFEDVQMKGPYKKWHHTHTFEALAGGTLVRDRIVYRVPLGLLGRAVAGTFIKKDLEKIFDYRRQKIDEFFRR